MRSKLFIILSFIVVATQYQNCSKISVAEMKAREKAEALGGNPIMSPPPKEDPPVAGVPRVADPFGFDDEDEDENDGIPKSTTPPPEDVNVRISSLCSDMRSNKYGNVVSAQTLELQLLDRDEKLLCKETDTALIKSNLAQKKIMFPKCSIPNGHYYVRLLNEKGSNLILEKERLLFVDGVPDHNRPVYIVMDSNPEKESELAEGIKEYAGTECDETASPLYVDLRRDASDMDILTSPEQGVLFDILGANARPVAHTKNQISWFEKGKLGLLALPNKDGDVLGIDELFGNNTAGPDGKFADNGFLALAKFDSNNDNVIDKDDAVFSSLRLFLDRNRNGIADRGNGKSGRGELITLDQANIVSIDLKYDPNYYEKDQYGNEIKYKSVVHKKNGKMKPIFDVWFAIKK